MPRKKQQMIEATLGRPKLRTSAPKPRAAQISSASSPKEVAGGSSQSWFYSPKTRKSPKLKSSQPPPSSFMPPSTSRKRITFADSSSSADEDNDLDGNEEATPKGKQSPAKRGTPGKDAKKQTHLKSGSSPRSAVVLDAEDSESESDDVPIATPKVSRRTPQGRKPLAAALSDDEDESDDKPLVTPTPRKRLVRRDDSDEEEDNQSDVRPTAAASSRSAQRTKRARSDSDQDQDQDDDDEIVVQSTKRRRLARKNGGAVSSSPAPRSSPTKRQHRSEKDKRRELLRRRRAGENITMEDLETSEEEGAHAALYDTDSDHVALEEFEDDEEGMFDAEAARTKKGKKDKMSKQPCGSGSEDEIDDFVASDDDTLGVPGELLDMPIEFTRHARKPLKEHFRDVVEWLVRFKFEPDFDEKRNELYMLGWKKLDDEVAALASSKFASSAWKPDFRRALNARPKFVCVELPRGDLDRLFSTCEACGRSGHPATWTVAFEGTAYHRKNNKDARFLEDVESSEDEDEDEEDDSSSADESNAAPSASEEPQRDEDGNELPPESRQWAVGAVCQSNAETAHTLIHWKHNLLEWVGDRLENDGHMTATQIAARARMKRKQKNKIVDEILADWDRQKVVEGLYREFKGVLDDARNKSTTGRRTGRWGM